jgi:tRNA-Thr(GGU) m(6)t(6)A37 methyltransferase TsaA
VTYSLTPIGHILTPFTQKFSIPRQGLSLSPANGEIVFADNIDVPQSLDGIEAFSHLWILFLFHENIAQGYKAKVRPPRLGGNRKIGVFASRSSFRPNAIGMSVVENKGLHNKRLIVGGVDLLSGTPILDIKPYLSYADAVPEAKSGYAQEKPLTLLEVVYTDKAEQALKLYEMKHPEIVNLITTILSQDPRPAYKRNKQDNKVYFIQLWDLELTWCVHQNIVELIDIYPAPK